MSEEEIVVVFCWYEQSEWEILKHSAADKDIFDDTYEEWKHNANQSISDMRALGRQVQKVKIKRDRLEAWCTEQGVENNAEARTHYAVYEAKRRTSTSTLKA